MAPYGEGDKTAYQLGPDDIWVPLGAAVHGALGDVCYRVRPQAGQERVPRYSPTNPRTRDQYAWRYVFDQGAAAWTALSDDEKATWRYDARWLHMTGYNLFMSNWLHTHEVVAYPWTVGTSLISSPDFIAWANPFTVATSKIGAGDYVRGPGPD